MRKVPSNNYTFHALKDHFLGGYQAVLRNNGKEKWRSPNSFPTRTAAIQAAKAHLHGTLHRG